MNYYLISVYDSTSRLESLLHFEKQTSLLVENLLRGQLFATIIIAVRFVFCVGRLIKLNEYARR